MRLQTSKAYRSSGKHLDFNSAGTNLKVGAHARIAGKKLLSSPLRLGSTSTITVVVLVNAFEMVSKKICLLFFYSRCPRGAHTKSAPLMTETYIISDGTSEKNLYRITNYTN